MINVKAPSGSRIEVSAAEVARVEEIVRRTVDPRDLQLVVSNIGVQPGFSSIYTSNAGPHTATVQVALHEDHRVSSFEYMERVRRAIQQELRSHPAAWSTRFSIRVSPRRSTCS